MHSQYISLFLSLHKEEDGGRRGLSKSFAIEKPRKDEDTHLESRRQDLEKGGKKRGDEGRVRFSPSTPIQQTRSPARRISFHPSPSPSAAHVPLWLRRFHGLSAVHGMLRIRSAAIQSYAWLPRVAAVLLAYTRLARTRPR